MEDSSGPPVDQGGLRERNVTSTAAKTAVPTPASSLVDKVQSEEACKSDSEKKTFGRTPDGTSRLSILSSSRRRRLIACDSLHRSLYP